MMVRKSEFWAYFVVVSVLVALFLTGCATTERVRYEISREEVLARGLSLTPEVWEDGYRTKELRIAFEWWYFDFSFTDGSTAVIVFAVKPLTNPSAPISPSASIVVTTPEGKRLAKWINVERDFFEASSSMCDVRVGKSHIRGDLKNYDIVFYSDGIRAELKLAGLVPPWRPGTGSVYYGDKFFAWLPAVPYGRVEGRLYYNGEWHTVRGNGYHDHNWGTVKLQDVQSQWYWGRAHIGDYTLIFSKMFLTKRFGDKRHYVFFLAKGDKILLGTNRVISFNALDWKNHRSGREYPTKIILEVKPPKGESPSGNFKGNKYPCRIKLEIDNRSLIEAMSLINSLPSIEKFFIKLFANPYYFRFKSNYRLSIDGKTTDGSGIFEMMLLRGKHTIRDD